MSALKLNATSLGVASYRGMFFDCKKLVTPPEIMATALSDGNGDAANGSLAQMFYNCTKLASIKVHFTSWNSGNYTRNWTYGTKSSGTFYKPSTLPSTKNTGKYYNSEGSTEAVPLTTQLHRASWNRFQATT